ncbi:MAG: right-handed parallel beta-helix repeat-containing protein [Candidatus Heimdallarchaeaceae archaeon]
MMNKTRKLLFIIFISLILFSLTSISNSYAHTVNIGTSQIQFNLAFTPHERIVISNDGNFTNYGFPGAGTLQDPYRIENYNITTLYTTGISIHDTTDYFIIQNCYIDAYFTGIAIYNITQGTGEISDVTCAEHSFYGIAISASKITVRNCISNDCSGSIGVGLLLLESKEITVYNNTFVNNEYGLYLDNSNSCRINYNTFKDSNSEGVVLDYNTYNNVVDHNKFINNKGGSSHQASDDGVGNIWYNEETEEGNYWDNWNDPNTPVPILGAAENEDPYPLEEDLTRTTNPTNLYFLSILLALAIVVYKKRTRNQK